MITGAPAGFAALAATDTGPIIYVGDDGGGKIALGRLTDNAWRLESLDDSPAVTRGRLAARGERIALTSWSNDLTARPMTRVLEFRGDGRASPEQVTAGCSLLTRHVLLLDGDRPIVLHDCQEGRIAIVERDGAGWRHRATIEMSGWFDATLDADGRIHIISLRDREHWTVTGTRAERHELPPAMTQLHAIAACADTVYATTDIEDGANVGHGVATWRDGTWTAEIVEREYVGWLNLGFDDACRVYVHGFSAIWAHDGARWVPSKLGMDQTIKAVVGIDGMLYAAYEEIENGVRVGIATSPLIEPTP